MIDRSRRRARILGTRTVSNTENLIGSSYNDTLTGNSSANVIKGGDGKDTINGGDDDDTLYGGGGTDTLTGGSDDDTFVFQSASAFSNVDTISDFNASDDKIDLHDILDAPFNPLSDAI
jgi:Ca2+-binding RTX toxin-like protein